MNCRSFVCAVLLVTTMSLGSAALAVHKSGHKKVHPQKTSQSSKGSKDKAQSKSDATTANKKSDDDGNGRMLDPQSVTGHK